MSEYVTVDVEYTDDADLAELYVNQLLATDGPEHYATESEGEVGSPLAQMLFTAVDGIQQLTVSQDCLTIKRKPSAPWEAIIDEVRDALRDWFL